jgi:hypothetical protein
MEVWKDIEGYEGLYQVSNLGRVKSLQRSVYHPIKKIQKIPEKILISDIRRGYHTVSFCKNGTKKSFLVHRLVAKNFVEKIIEKKEVNHIDGNKQNNNWSNLEWVTSSENQIHAVKNNLQKSGSESSNSKLDDLSVKKIRISDLSYKKLAELYNVSKSCIYLIKKHRTYKSI